MEIHANTAIKPNHKEMNMPNKHDVKLQHDRLAHFVTKGFVVIFTVGVSAWLTALIIL